MITRPLKRRRKRRRKSDSDDISAIEKISFSGYFDSFFGSNSLNFLADQRSLYDILTCCTSYLYVAVHITIHV
jgi:hypothetical protein